MRTRRRCAAWVAAALLTTGLQATGTARGAAETAAVAERKADVLEEKAVTGEPPPAAVRITAIEAEAVDPSGASPLDDPLTCLARTIYWEAKGEDRQGLEAIANVVMNRLGKDGFPDSVCGVVTEGRQRKACQFSWWCDGRPDDVEEPDRYALAKEIAREALNRQLRDRTNGALYFYREGTRKPEWAGEYRRVAEVGEHLFYKPLEGKAK